MIGPGARSGRAAQIQFSTSYQPTSSINWKHDVFVDNRYVFSNQFGLDLSFGFSEQANLQKREVALKGMYYF